LDPVSIFGILYLLWAGLQLIPLPGGVLQFLFPTQGPLGRPRGWRGGRGRFRSLFILMLR
jgi:hypothetical protein